MRTLTVVAILLTLPSCEAGGLLVVEQSGDSPTKCTPENAHEVCSPKVNPCLVGACATFGDCLFAPNCLCADDCDAGESECEGYDQCDDGDPTTADRCELAPECARGRCVHVGSECDHCDPAEMQQAVCDDGDACTADRCDESNACVQEPIVGCSID